MIVASGAVAKGVHHFTILNIFWRFLAFTMTILMFAVFAFQNRVVAGLSEIVEHDMLILKIFVLIHGISDGG